MRNDYPKRNGMKRRIVLPTRTGSYRAIRPLTPGSYGKHAVPFRMSRVSAKLSLINKPEKTVLLEWSMLRITRFGVWPDTGDSGQQKGGRAKD